jgi:hypothetical protein
MTAVFEDERGGSLLASLRANTSESMGDSIGSTQACKLLDDLALAVPVDVDGIIAAIRHGK